MKYWRLRHVDWYYDIYYIDLKPGWRQTTKVEKMNRITALIITVMGSPIFSAAHPAINELSGKAPKKKND